MNGDYLMQALIGAYLMIAIVSGFEGNWPRVLYWISASLLTISVLYMKYEAL